jgi:hypothetical protein
MLNKLMASRFTPMIIEEDDIVSENFNQEKKEIKMPTESFENPISMTTKGSTSYPEPVSIQQFHPENNSKQGIDELKQYIDDVIFKIGMISLSVLLTIIINVLIILLIIG